jgi:hypothetical protein
MSKFCEYKFTSLDSIRTGMAKPGIFTGRGASLAAGMTAAVIIVLGTAPPFARAIADDETTPASTDAAELQGGEAISADLPGDDPSPLIIIQQEAEVTDTEGQTIKLSPGTYAVDPIDETSLSLIESNADTGIIVNAEKVESGDGDRPDTADLLVDEGSPAIRYTSPDGVTFRVPLKVTGTMTRTWDYVRPPDMVATDVTTAPTKPTFTRNTTIRVKITAKNRNINNVRFLLMPCANPSRGATWAYYCMDYQYVSGATCSASSRAHINCIIDQIPVNQTKQVDVTVKFTGNSDVTRKTTVLVDSRNWIAEENENNNRKERSVQVTCATDLRVRYCGQRTGDNRSCETWRPTYRKGQPGVAIWDVSNTGVCTISNVTLDLSAPLFKARYGSYESCQDPYGCNAGFRCTNSENAGTARCSGGSLGPGKSSRIVFKIEGKSMVPGPTYTVNLSATVDPDNAIRNESSETNNTRTRSAYLKD